MGRVEQAVELSCAARWNSTRALVPGMQQRKVGPGDRHHVDRCEKTVQSLVLSTSPRSE